MSFPLRKLTILGISKNKPDEVGGKGPNGRETLSLR